jgi:predicted Zn-dependent protease
MSYQTVSVTLSPLGAEAAHRDAWFAHLRLEEDGRRGTASRDDHDVGALVDAALASARIGPHGPLLRPLPAPLPAVATSHPGAAALGVRELAGFAETLRGRAARAGRVVHGWAERSVGRVDVGNSRGVLAGYDTTMVGTGLSVAAPPTSGRLVVRLRHVATGSPDETVVAGLVSEVDD